MEKEEKQIVVLKNIALISGIFAMLLSVLIILNFIHWKRTDPLNSKALTILVEKLKQNPQDESLKEEIRELHLLTRKAYFTSTWQVRSGGILLFISILLIIICYHTIDMLKAKIPEKPLTARDELFFNKGRKRNAVFITGGIIIFISAVLAFIPDNDEKSAVAASLNDTISKSVNDSAGINKPVAEATDTSSGNVDSVSMEGFATNAELRQNWPCFRGFGGNGVSYQKNFPVSWDGKSGRNILWKTKIPLPGYNSPIVWNGKIYLSGASEKKREVYSIDAVSGKIVWTTEIKNVPGSSSQVPKVNKETGFAAPTLATDGRRVYSIFANGDIAALDFAGKILWSKNMGFPKNHYGHSSSLITWHDLVIVQYDQSGNAFVAALAGATGNEVWKTVRNVKVSWASPILVNTGKRTELILAAEPCIAAYDPSSGKELWRSDCISGEVGPSPVYAGGIVFSVNEYSKLAAVRPRETPVQLWEDSEYLSDVPSPVADDKYLYLTTSYGTLVCYDAQTGEKKWIQETGANMYASPVLADGKIYQLDQKGLMRIFAAGPVWNLIATADLGEGSFCTPAFAAGKIYIRGDKNLYCIGKR